MERVDAVVVGAGFGGLGAALALAEAGLDVVVCEALTYPGGCAGTYERHGARFEAGATLALGLGEGQWFRQVLDRYALPLDVRPVDPVIELRSPGAPVSIGAGRDGLRRALEALPGARPGLDGFLAEQSATADALFPLLDDPELLPPLGPRALLRHLGRLPRYLPLLRQVGRPLASVLRRHGLEDWTELRRVLEPLCRITVQVGVDEAEAPFALGALDAMVRGAAHVHGGMGALADALVEAVRRAGGRVRFADRVRGLRREGGAWRVDARKGELVTPRVLANVLPQQLTDLAGVETPALRRLSARVEAGWGAAMSYLQVPSDGLPPEAHHLDLVDDPDAPWRSGNHVFCSVSAAGEARTRDGLRTVVASTHAPLDADLPAVHAAMAATIARRAPELRVVRSWTASPRTFERFTKRHRGLVGGIPRRAGLGQYLALWPRPSARGLWLVGDSVLLGQSTLSAAISGARVAVAALQARVDGAPTGAEHPETESREAPLEVVGGGRHRGHGHPQR